MADYKVPSFLKKQGDSLLFNQKGEFVFYVPEIYFDRNNAEIIGEYVRLLGVLDYGLYNESGKIIGKPRRFFFPTVFLTKPYRIDKQKNVKLLPKVEPTDYRILRYKPNDIIVVSTKVAEDLSNVEDFFKLFLINAKLPVTIPYDKLQDYFPESMHLNGEDYGINMQMFGFIIGTVFRDPHNLKHPFRFTDMEDMCTYKPLSMTEVPKYISPNSSIGSENWDTALIGADLNPTDIESPMEKLLMGE